MARRGPLSIVQTKQGWVLAAAGIDASNVAQDLLVLLPEDGDASARALRARLGELLGVDVGVVVSDTFGRPWREGLTDVAVGSAGLPALIDHRGKVDAHGNQLDVTRTALVDELAAAADLVKGKLAGVPVAVVRGLTADRPEPDAGTRPLVRLPDDDLFPYGARDVVPSRTPGRDLVPRAGELDAVAEAFRVASAALPEFPVVLRYGGEGDGVVDVHLSDAVTTTTALNLGALLGAVIVQLHADGWATRWEPVHRRGHVARRPALARYDVVGVSGPKDPRQAPAARPGRPAASPPCRLRPAVAGGRRRGRAPWDRRIDGAARGRATRWRRRTRSRGRSSREGPAPAR